MMSAQKTHVFLTISAIWLIKFSFEKKTKNEQTVEQFSSTFNALFENFIFDNREEGIVRATLFTKIPENEIQRELAL